MLSNSFLIKFLSKIFLVVTISLKFRYAVPSDACFATQWYRLEDMDEIKTMGEILLAAWWGFQEVELTEAIDDPSPKAYFHPRLWYVRVVVVEANGIWSSNKSRSADVFVKVTMGIES